MPHPEIHQIDALLAWLRSYFAICAVVFLLAAVLGGWYASVHRDRWIWILPVMSVVYAACLAFHWPFTNDDAFIFYRYAENLASGMGPVYNPGVPCEGFTSPAWTAILALGNVLGFPSLLFSKSLGSACGAIVVIMTVLTIRHVTNDSRIIFATTYFVTTAQILMAWIPSGMDTALFVAWLAVWVYLSARPTVGSVPPILMAAIGGWIRPEAYIVSLIGICWSLYRRRDEMSVGRRLAEVSIVALAMMVPFVWRYLTFGELLPTTYYAKSDRTIRSGLGFLFGAVNGYGAIIWAIACFGLWKLRRAMPWAGVCVLIIAAYVTWVGGDVLIQRFSLWWMPFLVLGIAAGLNGILPAVKRDTRLALSLVLVLLGAQELHRMYSVTRPGAESDGYTYVASNAVHTAEADVPIGRYLAEIGARIDTVVTDNIGAIGYFSGMVIVDVLGLIDPEIARLIHEGRKAEIAVKIAANKPHWIVAYEDIGTKNLHLPNVGILPDELVRAYETIGRWQSRTGYTRLLLKRSERSQDVNAAPQN